MNLRVAGFSLALLTLVADQASKAYMLTVVRIGDRPPIRVAPFFDLTLVWNRGISYGLFQQHESAGQWALVVLSLVAAVVLSVWLVRTQVGVIAVALGLLIGGALGNAIDRALYVADSAIVAGVALLLYDSLVLEGRRGHAQAPAGTADSGPGM